MKRLLTLALILAAACSGQSTEATSNGSTAGSPVNKPSAPVTSTTAAPVPAGCTAADVADVAKINAALAAPATRLGEAFVATSDKGRWIMANIYPAAGDRLSSADVWLVVGDQIYSLSSDARSRTSFPDGRKAPVNASASDAPSTLEGCLTGSLRTENGAGPGG